MEAEEVVGVAVEEIAVVLFGHDVEEGRKQPFVARGDSNFERRRAATGKGGGRAAGSRRSHRRVDR
jgi:hypothetical protein